MKTLDYNTFSKIDANTHLHSTNPAYMEEAIKNNFRVLTVNVEYEDFFPEIEKQKEAAVELMKQFPGKIHFATTFTMKGWDEPGWLDKTMAYLEESFEQGAIAVKVWKNIGIVEKYKNGDFLMIDDAKFDPIFEYLAEKGIPLLGHIGEPKNCWLPVDEMTVNNDKDYYRQFPKYHLYLHPEYPRYEEIIAARDHMLEKHPKLKFIGLHLGSIEWSVDELAKRLEKYSNMVVDVTDRVCHLQYQSLTERDKVRRFMLKYQDRILYGTDFITEDSEDVSAMKARARENWTREWKFFTDDEMMTSPRVDGEFEGLGLPAGVIKKIYRTNAENWIPGI
ncbi:MAG: amidohydrolase family protein [Planctomycetota bacterium]|jgi:predicted TIM-barrel fold metal-dependent hydrolase